MSQTSKKNSFQDNNPKKIQLILASESPRRKDLLLKAGFSFHVFSVKVSEQLDKDLIDKLTLDEQILEIARRKAFGSLAAYKPSKELPFLILAADTMVLLEQQSLGKPRDEEQAAEFLASLSGRTHEVKTAVVLVEGPASTETLSKLSESPTGRLPDLKMRQFVETTKVIFKHLSARDIREYIMTGEPMDKAGAYGIQGVGGNFVEKFVGSYDNVVGLPIEVVRRLISDGDWALKTE